MVSQRLRSRVSPKTVSRRRPTALVIANRQARQVRLRLPSALEQLRDFGMELFLETPKQRSDSGALIREYRDRADLVVVGGGDGTLNAAADALVETGLPLGILPLGTANDLARTLGIPADVGEACRIIMAGHTRRIDVGSVNGKHFFNVASLGLSVRITQQLTKAVKRRWGVLAYLMTAGRVLWRSRPFRAEIRSGPDVWETTTVQLTVGNGRFYGGGMAVAADASIEDQRLDLYSLEVRRWWQVLGLLGPLRTGCLTDRSCVRTLSGREFEIRTQKRHRINTDGEITTSTPAVFRIVPQAVTVFVP